MQHPPLYEVKIEDLLISTDPALLPFETILGFLRQESYWAQGRRPETMRAAIENSLNFGLYRQGQLLAYARVVSDYCTFAWLCDVFVLPQARGQQLGKHLIRAVTAHPALNVKNFLLATSDAHGLYERYGGFAPLDKPEKWMIKHAAG